MTDNIYPTGSGVDANLTEKCSAAKEWVERESIRTWAKWPQTESIPNITFLVTSHFPGTKAKAHPWHFWSFLPPPDLAGFLTSPEKTVIGLVSFRQSFSKWPTWPHLKHVPMSRWHCPQWAFPQVGQVGIVPPRGFVGPWSPELVVPVFILLGGTTPDFLLSLS